MMPQIQCQIEPNLIGDMMECILIHYVFIIHIMVCTNQPLAVRVISIALHLVNQ